MTSSIETLRQEIGLLLRRYREEAGLSLKDLSARTRIGQRHLEALEQGDFAPLQGFIFVRGFVKSVCRELGRDSREIEELLAMAAPQETETPKEPPPQESPVSPYAKVWLLFLYAALGAGLVILFMVMAGGREREGKGLSTTAPARAQTVAAQPPQAVPAIAGTPVPPQAVAPTAPAPTAPVAKPASASAGSAVQAPRAMPPAIPPAPRVSARTATPVPPVPIPRRDQDLRLKITAVEKSWLRVQTDEDNPWEATLRSGDEAKFVARERITLQIGNGGGVVFDLNGRQIGPPGTPGQVINNYVLTRDNL